MLADTQKEPQAAETGGLRYLLAESFAELRAALSCEQFPCHSKIK